MRCVENGLGPVWDENIGVPARLYSVALSIQAKEARTETFSSRLSGVSVMPRSERSRCEAINVRARDQGDHSSKTQGVAQGREYYASREGDRQGALDAQKSLPN